MTRDKTAAPRQLRAEIHHCLKLTDPKVMLQYFLHTQTQQDWAHNKCVSEFNSLTKQLRETLLESLQDSWILTAITAPASVEDILQIPEVLFSFIRKHLLKNLVLLSTNKISSTESKTSGLCYCVVQRTVDFLLTRSENLDLKTEDEQVEPNTGALFAFRNNMGFIKKNKKWKFCCYFPAANKEKEWKMTLF